jgi:hypothetical protein
MYDQDEDLLDDVVPALVHRIHELEALIDRLETQERINREAIIAIVKAQQGVVECPHCRERFPAFLFRDVPKDGSQTVQ